jgi:hypothetical protein
VKHLDEVVDFVVGDLGAGYLKLDYNIDVGPGTDVGGLSAGPESGRAGDDVPRHASFLDTLSRSAVSDWPPRATTAAVQCRVAPNPASARTGQQIGDLAVTLSPALAEHSHASPCDLTLI